MRTLLATLSEYDIDLLKIIANRWDVDLKTRDPRTAAEQLAGAMLDPSLAAHEWSRLDDRERGALQMLLGAKQRKMPLAQYQRLFGEIRQMGPDRLGREKPYLTPTGKAETLYYRGLLGVTYAQAAAGKQPFVYVPDDLADVLPSHQTGYDLSKAEPGEEDFPADEGEEETVEEKGEPTTVTRADTALVDDLTTLLAYLQIESVRLEGGTLRPFDRQAVEQYLIGTAHPARIALMMALIQGLGLASDNGEAFKPIPANIKKWLEQARTAQVQSLTTAWLTSTAYNELDLIPGLIIENADNDPRLLRGTIKRFLKVVPAEDWFAVDDFLLAIKEDEPDFQRPAADYESWYIRDAETDDYLKGFDHWPRIEGAALRLTLLQPMHWLGLVDTGEGNGLAAARLTAYGRAFAEISEWPERPDPESAFTLQPDGTLSVPRAASRYSRFQLARFTEWGLPGNQYEYRLSGAGFMQAEQQGIKAEHILTFLKRISGDKVPPPILEMIEGWEQTGNATVTLSALTVMQVDSEEVLNTLFNTPEIRRFLGARLGPRAVVVREGQSRSLAQTLQERGMLVESDT